MERATSVLIAKSGVSDLALLSLDERRGRAHGIADGQTGAVTGAVTFVQRFGGALNLNPHLYSIVPDGLFVADGRAQDGTAGRLRFEPLPPPTTADVEELTATIARRLMDWVAAAWEADGNGYLDPDLALCDTFFFSRDPPVGRLGTPSLPRIESASPWSKPLCGFVEGFSLHAGQSVADDDREALEQLLRYGLRAPFSQERLSRNADGKVVYRLRRPWPNARGATPLSLEPLDFLRRLAALVSFPYSHAVRYHGLFADRSRLRLLLPTPATAPGGHRERGDDAYGSAPLPCLPSRQRLTC